MNIAKGFIDEWLKDFIIGENKIKKQIDQFQDKVEPHQWIYKVSFFTENNDYTLYATSSERTNYLGCLATCRKIRPGEGNTRSDMIFEGSLTNDSWNDLKNSILRYETVEMNNKDWDFETTTKDDWFANKRSLSVNNDHIFSSERKENKMEILVPESDLKTDEDRFGFLLFVKALHFILRMDEGIYIEHEGKKYIVHKFKDEETNEELVGIQIDPDFGNEDIKNGTMVWCDLEKPQEERHGDNE